MRIHDYRGVNMYALAVTFKIFGFLLQQYGCKHFCFFRFRPINFAYSLKGKGHRASDSDYFRFFLRLLLSNDHISLAVFLLASCPSRPDVDTSATT